VLGSIYSSILQSLEAGICHGFSLEMGMKWEMDQGFWVGQTFIKIWGMGISWGVYMFSPLLLLVCYLCPEGQRAIFRFDGLLFCELHIYTI
jgi:hypothetical protein